MIVFLIGSPALGQSLPVTPYPQEVRYEEGAFPLDRPLVHEYAGDTTWMAWQLLSSLPRADRGAPPTDLSPLPLRMGIPAQDAALAAMVAAKNAHPDTLGREGYHLLIEPGQILLAANAEAGLLYGVQTLRQLFRAFREEGRLPAARIIDYPAFPYRGVMDDISRGPLSNLDFIKKQTERLSELKVNVFSFYIEHVVKTEKHPGFAPPEALTIEAFRELSAFAKPYNITLLGSFQSLGHLRTVLSTPEYAPLGFTDRMVKPADPAVLRFLTDVYDEMAPAFSSEVFNINCDEAWDLKTATGEQPGATEASLFVDHVRPLIAHLRALGKRPALWGDILLSHPEIMEQLPPESLILTWNYGPNDSFSDWIDPIRAAGFDFWVCPGVVNSNRLMPDYRETLVNIRNFSRDGHANGAQGVFNTVWDDGGRHFFTRDWYGVSYGAEHSWCPDARTESDFDDRFSRGVLGDPHGRLPRFIRQLNKLAATSGAQDMKNAILERALLPAPGKTLRINRGEWEEILEIIAPARSMLDSLEATNGLHWKEDPAFWSFTVRQLQLAAETRLRLLDGAAVCRAKPDDSEGYRDFADNLRALGQDWQALRDDFRQLWLKENRRYWLPEALDFYERTIADIDALRQRAAALEKRADKDLLAVGLNFEEHQGYYFTYWLFSESFPAEGENGLEKDYLNGQGGETEVRPSPFEWQKYQSPYSDRIDLGELIDGEAPRVIYAYCRIESDRARSVQANLSTSHGAAMILNGRRMGVFPGGGVTPPFALDRITTRLQLQKGKNHLVFKLLSQEGAGAFSFRLPGLEMRNHKYKYRVQERAAER